jgi:hypothetical protein
MVLGAPGSGMTTITALLDKLLPGHVVLDWDLFMAPAAALAAALAGRDIRSSPETWPAYRQLVWSFAETIAHQPVVLLGVCTPAELEDWPLGAWVLVDCSDQERRRRLVSYDLAAEIQAAISDAREYRSLNPPVIDTTGLLPAETARQLAEFVRRQQPGPPDAAAGSGYAS